MIGQRLVSLQHKQVGCSGPTEEGDGTAELTTPATSDFGVELIQLLHDAAIAHLSITQVAWETRAPAGQRRRGQLIAGGAERLERVDERSGHTH